MECYGCQSNFYLKSKFISEYNDSCYFQYNGVLSSHSQIEDEQMLAKSKPFMTSLNFESPSKTIQIGSSGDFGSALSYFEGR